MGGWTNGLLATGWDVVGVDVTAWQGYQGRLIQKDVRELKASDLPAGIKLVVASPPCQEFSYRAFPFKKCKNLPPPDLSIWRACERIIRELKVPGIIENVRNAQTYLGRATCHYGSYYFWGDLPVLIPTGHPIKGGWGPGRFGNKTRSEFSQAKVSSKFQKRKNWSAEIAMIPLEFSSWIGQVYAS